MKRALGSLVVDEQIVPITELRLERGALIITAHVAGPAPAADSGTYTVIGRDGAEVWQSHGHRPPIQWPRLRCGDELNLTVRVDVLLAGPSAHALT